MKISQIIERIRCGRSHSCITNSSYYNDKIFKYIEIITNQTLVWSMCEPVPMVMRNLFSNFPFWINSDHAQINIYYIDCIEIHLSGILWMRFYVQQTFGGIELFEVGSNVEIFDSCRSEKWKLETLKLWTRCMFWKKSKVFLYFAKRIRTFDSWWLVCEMEQ